MNQSAHASIALSKTCMYKCFHANSMGTSVQAIHDWFCRAKTKTISGHFTSHNKQHNESIRTQSEYNYR